MAEKTPRFLRDKSATRRTRYKEVTPRVITPPNTRALRNLSRLSVASSMRGIAPNKLEKIMLKIASGDNIRSRLEPKSTPGKFRELWIPTDEDYQDLLKRLSKIFGSFSTSPETIAFRKGLGPAKGLRLMLDEYEDACDERGIPKKQNAQSEGHIIGTCYQGDIKNYYGTITYEQVAEFIRFRFSQMLETKLSEEEIIELSDLVADIVCPGEVLPQGFSTSPAIANGIGVPMDRQIRQGARAVLGDDQISVVGRYADDIVVMASGEFNDKVLKVMANVLDRNGFRLHPGKVDVTRALEEGKSSRIEVFQTIVRNDGDGPLSFGPPSRYVREIRDALRYLLSLDHTDEDVLREVTQKKGGPLGKVRGGLNYVSDTLYWGLPHGITLRKGQECLLPRGLEKLWLDLRKKFESVLSSRQKRTFDLKNKDTRKSKEKVELSIDEAFTSVFKYRTKYQLEISEDPKQGRGFVVRDQDGNIIMQVDKSTLENEGFPTDPEEIEDFLLKLEGFLNSETESLKEEIDASEIKDLSDLHKNPDLEARFYKHYLEFVKWHLCTLLNIPDLKPENLGDLFDTDKIYVDPDTNLPKRDSDGYVLPWGIEDCYKNFKEKFEKRRDGIFPVRFLVSTSMSKVLMAPIWTNDVSIEGKSLFIPKNRNKSRRDGRGHFRSLPGFKLKTVSGFPVKSKKKRKKGEEDKTNGRPDNETTTKPSGESFDQIVFERSAGETQ